MEMRSGLARPAEIMLGAIQDLSYEIGRQAVDGDEVLQSAS